VRKLYRVPKTRAEVVIIDELLSNWLLHCIPTYCKYNIVKNRGVTPYVWSLSFFLNLIKYTLRFGLRNKSIILAIIGELKPKVVITFIDNNVVSYGLFRIYPEIRFISIQNGTRSLLEINAVGEDKFDFDSYFGFGLYEKELFISKGGSFSNYHAAGSLKLGLFLSRYNYFPSKEKKNTICFVSQFRRNIMINGEHYHNQFIGISKDLYRATVNYAKLNGYNVNVAMCNSNLDPDYNFEINYFQKIVSADIVSFFENSHNKDLNFTSYKIAIESDLVVGMDSTLLMEMYGCKKRVVWGIKSQLGYTEDWGLETLAECDDSFDIAFFNTKLNFLLKMSDQKYADLTRKSREFFFTNSEKPYPHEVIKNDIDKYLSSII
jgi:surface carbohydrate biosynthesis protein